MTAKIYKPSKTAMQSGRKTKISRGCEWVLAYMRKSAAKPDQLMGWQSSSDTARQVKMYFPDLESAVAYAEANDIDYVVQQPKSRRVKPRAYADNFAFTRNGAWTHWSQAKPAAVFVTIMQIRIFEVVLIGGFRLALWLG